VRGFCVGLSGDWRARRFPVAGWKKKANKAETGRTSRGRWGPPGCGEGFVGEARCRTEAEYLALEEPWADEYLTGERGGPSRRCPSASQRRGRQGGGGREDESRGQRVAELKQTRLCRLAGRVCDLIKCGAFIFAFLRYPRPNASSYRLTLYLRPQKSSAQGSATACSNRQSVARLG
jgi:hypothetical protein